MKFFKVLFFVPVLLLWFRAPPKKDLFLNEWFSSSSDKLHVLATTKMVADLVENVGQEHVRVLTLIKEDLDPHTYTLVKGDADKFRRSDIVFANGLHLEHSQSLHNLLDNPKTIYLADVLKEKRGVDFCNLDENVDPHFWMDVHLFSQSVPIIVQQLSQAAPEHEATFRQNGEILQRRLQQLDEEIYLLMQSIPPQKRYLVTSHDAFQYFAKRYLFDQSNPNFDLERFLAPEGVSPDGQIGPSDIQKIISHIVKHEIGVVFAESNISKDSLSKIQESCSEQGIELIIAKEELFADSMGCTSYIDMMRHNARVIYNELNHEHIRVELPNEKKDN
jgi:manganese/zinc/iron transport system substrate-binding protein